MFFTDSGLHGSPSESSELESVRPITAGEEELQLQLALAMSKEEHDEDVKRRKGDEIKLQMAIEESKKEEEVIEYTPPGKKLSSMASQNTMQFCTFAN